MIVYLIADLEGVSGMGRYDTFDAARPQDTVQRERVLSLWVDEINAAVSGCTAAGAERVLVLDNHAGGDTLPLGALHPRAYLTHGGQRPTWLPGLKEDVHAVVMLGQHARAGSRGHLCHTYSRTRLRGVRVNGRPVGEIGLIAGVAAERGVPCALASGDDIAMAEALECAPGIRTVTAKHRLSLHACVSVPHEEVCARLHEQTLRGVRDPVPAAAWLRVPEYCLTVQYRLRDAWRAVARLLLRPRSGLRLNGWGRLTTVDGRLSGAWDRLIGLRGED